MWNYIVEVPEGGDVAEAVMAKHRAHIARYPGVSQEHAIAATPTVEQAAAKAAAAAAKLAAKGAVKISVAGPDTYDKDIVVEASAEAL